MFCLKKRKRKPYLKMRPAGDQANRAQSQREKKPHDPHNIISLPDHINDNQHPPQSNCGRCFGADWLKTQIQILKYLSV